MEFRGGRRLDYTIARSGNLSVNYVDVLILDSQSDTRPYTTALWQLNRKRDI